MSKMICRIAVAVCLLALPAGAAAAASCASERGAAAAKVLVGRCFFVSPSTHPPCNAANPCAMIEDHIRWACGLLKDHDPPGFCKSD